MSPGHSHPKASFRLAAALAVAALALAGCGSDEEGTKTGEDRAPKSATIPSEGAPDSGISTRPGGPGDGPAPDAGGGGQAGEDPFSEGAGGEEAALIATARAYVRAINARDGAGVCGLLAPGALRMVRLPEPRGGCASSVAASIGHIEPGGPTWRRTRIARIGPVELNPDSGRGRAVTTIVTSFAGDREPSIEEDLIYLQREGDRWLVAKASTTLYRAIGAREVPLSAITPP